MSVEAWQLRDIVSGSATRLDLWNRMLKAANVRVMAEVGVWMIDPWTHLPDWNKPSNVDPEVFDDVYAEAMKKTSFASTKIVVLKGRTKEVIDRIADQSLDLAYIDGDHTLRGITIDLIKLLPKVREGGLIGGDDFTSTPWQHDVRFEPTLVCPFSIYFAEAADLPIVALPFNQFLIQKRTDSSFSFTDTTGNYSDVSLNKLPAGLV